MLNTERTKYDNLLKEMDIDGNMEYVYILVTNLNSWREISLDKKIGEGVYGDVDFCSQLILGLASSLSWVSSSMQSNQKKAHTEGCWKNNWRTEAHEVIYDDVTYNQEPKTSKCYITNGSLFKWQAANYDCYRICFKVFNIYISQCIRGDLKSVAPNVLDLSKRLKFALDIAKGLSWLAAHNIVHRDLKLPNLLVDEDYTIKVG